MITYVRTGQVSCCAVLLLAAAGHVWAVPLVGSSFTGTSGAVLYDINPLTGQASHPRATGIQNLVGMAFSADARLYGLSNSTASVNPNSLFRINPATGAAQLIGPTGLDAVTEGDLAFDPTTGTLYGTHNLDAGSRQLFTLDLETGAATVLPGSLAGDPSGMAFGNDGTLYILDTALQRLATIDKTSAAILSFVNLNVALGSTAGMAVDPGTGTFYVADGQSSGTDRLYTLNPSTGVLTQAGPLGLDTGLAGLVFVPEPGAALLLGLAGGLVLVRRRRPARR